MSERRIPKPGEVWQFRYWQMIGNTRGCVTIVEVLDAGDHPSVDEPTVIYMYAAGDSASTTIDAFCSTYVPADDVPTGDDDPSRPRLEVVR